MSDSHQKLVAAWRVHQQGNIPVAKQAYEEVLRKEPNNANAWCYLGIALHDQRDYAKAVEAYEKAIALHPSLRNFLQREHCEQVWGCITMSEILRHSSATSRRS